MLGPNKNARLLSDLLKKVAEKKPEKETLAQVNSSFCLNKNKIVEFTQSLSAMRTKLSGLAKRSFVAPLLGMTDVGKILRKSCHSEGNSPKNLCLEKGDPSLTLRMTDSGKIFPKTNLAPQCPRALTSLKKGSFVVSLLGMIDGGEVAHTAQPKSVEKAVFAKPKKVAAFTLAEVLVTLGVIGIVAAMTLPSLISNYKKNVAETRLKHAYSLIIQAIQIAEYENEIGFPFEIGESVNSDVNGYSWENSQKLYELYFKKHIIAQKTYPKSYKPANNSYTYGLKERYPVDNFSYYAELGNGVLLGLVRNGSKSFSWYIILDKNAKQLVRGKNYFYITFALTKNGYVNEWYRKFSTDQLYEHCGSNTNELLAFVRQQGSCMEIIRRNNFHIPKDYPIPF